MSALAMILAAGMVLGDGPEIVSGEVQLEFPPGSKWVAVEGWKGNTKVTEASVTFQSGNKVEIYWKIGTAIDFVTTTQTREYRVDRLSKLPVIPTSLPGVACFSDCEPTADRSVLCRLCVPSTRPRSSPSRPLQ
jgi:hypothetical protein